MPTYFFHTENGHHHADPDGSEMSDVEAAKSAAVQILSEMLRGAACSFWETEALRLIVTDDQGLTLFRLELCAVVDPSLRAEMPGPRQSADRA